MTIVAVPDSQTAADAIVEIAAVPFDREFVVHGVPAGRLPLGDLHSNWAYSVIATLAWNLSRWIGLMLPDQIVRTGRRLVVRLLDWNPWRHVFPRRRGDPDVIEP